MTAKTAITLSWSAIAVMVTISIAGMGWQWGLNTKVTTHEIEITDTKEEMKEFKEEMRDFKNLIIQGNLMNSKKLDDIQEDVNDVKIKLQNKRDR